VAIGTLGAQTGGGGQIDYQSHPENGRGLLFKECIGVEESIRLIFADESGKRVNRGDRMNGHCSED